MAQICSRSPILVFRMCFGIRKLTPFHMATSILHIQNHKYHKNAINACTDTQIYPLLTSSIQYKALLCSCGPIFRGAYDVFDDIFLMKGCISSLRTIFKKKSERIEFFRYPPLAWVLGNTVLAPSQAETVHTSCSIQMNCSCFEE